MASLIGAASVTALLSTSAAAATHAPRDSVSSAQSEAVAIRSARWMSNVTVSMAKGSWTFKSTGVPPADYLAPYYAAPTNPDAVSAVGAHVNASASTVKEQNYDYTLPETPKYSKTTTAANQGPIGVALDGAVFYNPYEANKSTVATTDNFIVTSGGVTASFLDDCDGHPNQNGQYHYHGLPACLAAYAAGETVSHVEPVSSTSGSTTAAVSEATKAARKPVLLGFAFDGYGIYDNIAMDGKTIPVSKLDSCNGIFSPVPGYPHGVYHYVLENIKGARADIGCYHGVVSSAYTKALQSTLGATGTGGGQASGSAGGSQGGAGSTPPSSTPPNGGPPPKNPPGGGPAGANARPQTADSLAANLDEDKLLRAVLAVSGNNDCG